MPNIQYTAQLDFTDNGTFETGWRIKQGDYNESILVIRVVNNGVNMYDANVTPTIAFKRADGKSVVGEMTPNDGTYTYTLVGNEIAVPGPTLVDVKYVDSEGRISTASCRFNVIEDTIGYDPTGASTYNNPVSQLVAQATEDSLIAEGFAVGQQRGQDVPSTSPYYHNNAKYYSEESVHTTFASLTDVSLSNLQNGQVPVYNSTTQKWENGSGGGGASLPIDISDNTNNVTGILNVANGGTGNSDGYVRVGQKANTTMGNKATAEGYDTTASSSAAHAEGYDTTASGLYTHAEGGGTTASGAYSHAEGRGTVAKGANSHAQGKYNIQDSAGTYAHIVGNGTADNARSNAHTLDWSGNAWFAGTVTDGTGNVLSNKQDALPTVVNDRYLHTNASTGALEWAQGGGGSSATILTSTLTAGNTTITFTNNAITSTALIDIYTDDPDVGWESRSVSSTTLTITFPVQASDLSVKVRIEESGV